MLLSFIVINSIYFYPSNTITYDVFGYYIYLPLTFIVDGNSQDAIDFLQNIKSTYSTSETLYQIQTLNDGGFVMKYTSGWAVCYAPFFMISHLIAQFTDYPADGFSAPYQIGVFIGSLTYALIGVYFLFKVLRCFFNSILSFVLLTLIVFGTNYLMHVTFYGQNAMSHNLLFTGYTLIIWLTIKWYDRQQLKTILLLGLVCGLMILTRPTEIVCLFIPLLWPYRSKESRKSFFKKHLKQLIIFTLIIIVIGSIQLIYWKIKTGHFLFTDYGNPAEGLDFLAPHTLDTLFSFRKGWYVYTPLMLLATLGFIVLYRKDRKLFIPLFTFFILNLYLVSSWSCWWYATSFSQRALIPSMVIMSIPLGHLLQYLWSKGNTLRVIVGAVFSTLTFLNIFQTMQYYYGVIPGDGMTKEYYFASFGSLSQDKNLKTELLLIDRFNWQNIDYKNESKYSERVIYETSFEYMPGTRSEYSFTGNKSFELNGQSIYTPPFKIPYNEITDKDHVFIQITAKVYKTKQENNNPTLLTSSFDYKNAVYKWEKKSLINLPIHQWSEIEMIYLTPETRTDEDKLTVQFWHRSDSSIFIDDLVIKAFEPK
jgi:hypothetical protein